MKKIISVIISICIFFQLIPVFAEDAASLQHPHSPDIVFAASLGILEDDVDQAASITRAELASVFYHIVMSDSSPRIGASKYFTDVDYEQSAYTDFAYQCGIMNGVGDSLFSPDTSVTFAQLLKAVVSFLGYGAYAESKGGYPYGYITMAQELDLIGSSAPSADAVITNNMVASVFRLAANVPLMDRVTFGDDGEKYEINEDSDYLRVYMDITRIRGTVSGNYLTDLNDGVLDYNQVMISNQLFKITEASEELINQFGCEVDVYCRSYGSGNVGEVMYYELTDSNTVLSVDSDDVEGYEASSFVYCEDKRARLSSDVKVIYNGTLVSSYDADIFNPFVNSSLEGSVTLIDNDGDSRYDIANIDAYSSYVVSKVVGNVIFNEFVPSEVVDLGKNFADGDISISNVLGQPISLADIESGDIINVSRDKSGKVKRIVVTIDNFTGILDGISSGDGLIIVDGNEFEISKNLGSKVNLKLGGKITLYFNKSGKVSDVRAADDKYKIGYIAAASESTGLQAEYRLRIFTSGGEFEDLTLAEKVKLSDTGTTVSDSQAYASLPKDSGGSVRQPILYTVNTDGKLNWIDYCKGTEPRDGIYMIEGFEGQTQMLHYRSNQYNFESKLLINASTVIFNVPKDNVPTDYDNYYIESTSYYGNGDRNIDFVAYGLTAEGSPCAAILVDKDGVKNVSADSDLLVINAVTKIIDADGIERYKVSGFTYSGGMSEFVVEEDALESVFGSAMPTRGDIIQSRAIDGVVKYVKNLFDFETKKFVSSTDPSAADFDSTFRCIYGDVVYNDGTYIKIQPEGSDTFEAYPLSSVKIVEIDYSKDDEGVMSVSKVSNIYDTRNYPAHFSKVLLRTRYGDARTLVVFNGLGGAK